jgi:hypothetical protein
LIYYHTYDNPTLLQTLPFSPSHQYHSLEERQLVLMNSADETGDVAFIVGPSNTRICAHSIIVRSASPVKLFHESMAEGKNKEVKISHHGVKAFRSVAITVIRTYVLF